MKRKVMWSALGLSLVGLMVFARGGGGGGHRGGGHTGGNTGTVARMAQSSGRSMAIRGSRPQSVNRGNGQAFHNHTHGGHGHNHGPRRHVWSGNPFWGNSYANYYSYCDANPWDERCYEDELIYDDYIPERRPLIEIGGRGGLFNLGF